MEKPLRHSHSGFFIPSTILAIFFGLFPLLHIANAGDVTLAWDANTESNLAGYKLYYDSDSSTEMYQGIGATEGDSPVPIYLEDLADPDSPIFSLTGLENGQYYYFVLTAFDTDGLESDFSNEVGTMISDGDGSGGDDTADDIVENTVSDGGDDTVDDTESGTSDDIVDDTGSGTSDEAVDDSGNGGGGGGGGGCFISNLF